MTFCWLVDVFVAWSQLALSRSRHHNIHIIHANIFPRLLRSLLLLSLLLYCYYFYYILLMSHTPTATADATVTIRSTVVMKTYVGPPNTIEHKKNGDRKLLRSVAVLSHTTPLYCYNMRTTTTPNNETLLDQAETNQLRMSAERAGAVLRESMEPAPARLAATGAMVTAEQAGRYCVPIKLKRLYRERKLGSPFAKEDEDANRRDDGIVRTTQRTQ